MNNQIYGQLARSGLLPDDLATAILAYPSEEPHLDTAGAGYRWCVAHAVGVSSASR
jgi:hypothetical protein